MNPKFMPDHQFTANKYDSDTINRLFGSEKDIKTGKLNSRIQSFIAYPIERIKIFKENRQFRNDNKLATKLQVNENMTHKGTRIAERRDIIKAKSSEEKIIHLGKLMDATNGSEALANYRVNNANRDKSIGIAKSNQKLTGKLSM